MPWLMSEFRGTGAVSSPVEDGPSVGSGSIQNHGAQHLSEQEAIASSLGLTVSQATMIFQRCLLGESFYDVAEEFGVTIDQVIVLMKLGGMSMRWRRVGERDRQEMRRRYVDERESVKNIGEALGFSGATVGRHLVSLGVKMRGPRGRERA